MSFWLVPALVLVQSSTGIEAGLVFSEVAFINMRMYFPLNSRDLGGKSCFNHKLSQLN